MKKSDQEVRGFYSPCSKKLTSLYIWGRGWVSLKGTKNDLGEGVGQVYLITKKLCHFNEFNEFLNCLLNIQGLGINDKKHVPIGNLI